MKPTEHEMTVAVDAAARHVWADVLTALGRTGTFDELDPLTQNRYRERVLGFVMAALEALPDRGEGAILWAADACCTCHTGNLEHEDWCVSIGILTTAETGQYRERRCRECGCTDDRACSPPCWWIEADLCSSCGPRVVELEAAVDRVLQLHADDDGSLLAPGRWCPGCGEPRPCRTRRALAGGQPG